MTESAAPVGRRPAGGLISVQLARGIAVLIVMFHHAKLTEPKYYDDLNVLPDVHALGLVGVDLFFVLSGFVMGYTTETQHGSLRNAAVFLWKRLFRIYPMYWIYCTALVPVVIFLPTWINQSQGGRIDILASYLLWPTETFPILLVAWSLVLEMWFFLVFVVVLLLPRKVLPLALGAWAAVLILVNIVGPIPAPTPLELPQNALALEFISGVVISLGFRRMPVWMGWVAPVLGLALVVVVGQQTPPELFTGTGLARPLSIGIGYALFLLGLVVLERRYGFERFARFTFLGNMSYSLFLCHVLVLAVMGRVWAVIWPHVGLTIWGSAVWWVLTFGAILLVGWLSYRILEVPLMRTSTRLRRRIFGASATPTSRVSAPSPATQSTPIS